jgi:hypothetical protein
VGQIAGHSAKPRHSNNSAVNNNSLRNATIQAGLEKPGFKTKQAQWVFWVFLVFLVFFVFFVGFFGFFLYIFAQKREFLGFF